jgi:hypothetical protein
LEKSKGLITTTGKRELYLLLFILFPKVSGCLAGPLRLLLGHVPCVLSHVLPLFHVRPYSLFLILSLLELLIFGHLCSSQLKSNFIDFHCDEFCTSFSPHQQFIFLLVSENVPFKLSTYSIQYQVPHSTPL